jgi:hypothetical protein
MSRYTVALNWRLDSHEAQLDVIRDAITEELSGYQAEAPNIREQRATMQAAALNATMSKPLKSKLGE